MIKKKTIFRRIFIPLFAVMIFQAAIFLVVVLAGPVIQTLNDNAKDIVAERVENRKNELQTYFNNKWNNLSAYKASFNQRITNYNIEEFINDPNKKRDFLKENYQTLISIVRNNSVNSAFIILANPSDFQQGSSSTTSYYGLCIRDYDPSSIYTDAEDLLVTVGPSSIIPDIGISLDSDWEPVYNLDARLASDSYYYKPLQAAINNPGVSSENLGYLEGLHQYGTNGRGFISYSIPLISESGEVYGVLGVELTTSLLNKAIPAGEVYGANNGSYILAIHEEGTTNYQVITKSGILFTQAFGNADNITINGTENAQENSSFTYSTNTKLKLYGYGSQVKIYNQNTPFENEKLVIVGLVRNDVLFSVTNEVRVSLIVACLIMLVFGVAGIFVVSHLLSVPVQNLAKQVESSTDNSSNLKRVNIYEIDQLVDAIIDNSQKINQSKVRTEFFSRMSHDMRTPMNAIIGFSSPEVVEDSSKQELVEYLMKINDSGQYLLGLINEVLDITKIDSGKMEISQKAFELNSVWEKTIPMIEELANNKKLIFTAEINKLPETWVIGDSQRIGQIIVNLLSNAIKFTPKGGRVTFKVENTKIDNKKVRMLMKVADTGTGMSEEFQEKLYQPFVQEHPNKEGTGLGLSISYQLIRLMNGTITCHSEVNKGTEFTVDLPLDITDKAPNQDNRIVNYSEEELLSSLKGKRVLLCEDHPMNRQIAGKLLNKYQIETDYAENGQIGLEMFEKSAINQYDYVLMDIRMPVMNGLETAKAIRSLNRADAKQMPIIAMTANAFTEDIQASKAAGMNEHLSKPIEPQVLFSTLMKYRK